MDSTTITSARWAKAPDRRAPNQRTAHLLLSLNSVDAANRAITNGLSICNKRCHVERAKREPTRCLKCQGWNHFAKECTAENDMVTAQDLTDQATALRLRRTASPANPKIMRAGADPARLSSENSMNSISGTPTTHCNTFLQPILGRGQPPAH